MYHTESRWVRLNAPELNERYEDGWELVSETYVPAVHPQEAGRPSWCYVFRRRESAR